MFVNVDQNTDEWLDLRTGKATSSNFAKVMANYGKAFGEGAKKYARKLALEIVTGQRDERSSYTNKNMQDGNDLEPELISRYSKYIFDKEFLEVTNGGFYYDGNYGDSPDGNVGDNGSLEGKCVIANTQWERLENGGYDLAYKWQIQGHIWLGKKEWCDFVSFCPEMPEDKKIYVYRVMRDDAMIEQLQERLKDFWDTMVLPRVEILKNKTI